MKSLIKIGILSSCLLLIAGCSTTGTFVVPEDSLLYINHRPQPIVVQKDGKVSTRPYFWTSIAGIPHRLEKDGETIKEGKLRARFRPAAIFWPPYALIYWPAGLNPDITYDLINDTQE